MGLAEMGQEWVGVVGTGRHRSCATLAHMLAVAGGWGNTYHHTKMPRGAWGEAGAGRKSEENRSALSSALHRRCCSHLQCPQSGSWRSFPPPVAAT